MTLEPLRDAVTRPRAATAEVAVLVAGGSAQSRRGVRAVLADDPRFTVLGEARTRADLLTLAAQLRPAAVVLDPELPHGVLPALAELMATHPVPVVIYGPAELITPSMQADLRAAGAVDVVVRVPVEPSPSGRRDPRELRYAAGDDLRACLLLASRIRVIRHPRGRLLRPATGPTAGALVVLGASTGGPSALGTVLAALPPGLSAAVLVIQHMPAGFLSGLAGWLDSTCALPVSVGADGDLLQPGEVLVCPGGLDSVIEPAPAPAAGRLRCLRPQPDAHHIPSVDRAFTSAAAVLGPRAVGVLLTGMGRDGAGGMAALHAAGAATIAQDENTSAIYGMPQAAIAAGAVDRILPLPEIAEAIVGQVAAAARERSAT